MSKENTQFKSGEEWTGNKNGRPKGKTIKDMVRDYLDKNPDKMAEFVEHFVEKQRDLAWQMLEGRPSQGIGQAEDLDPITIVKYDDRPIQTKTIPDTTA